MKNRAVFLDRDGTMIEHYDYLTDPSQVQLLPTTATALRRLREHDFFLVIVTNQSAVARGMLTEDKLNEIHNRLKALLAECGAYVDQVYYCPCHPEGAIEKYRRDSHLRKPAPGMLELAADELDIDLAQSWIVGDDDRDIETGKNAHCRTILIESRSLSPFVKRGNSAPDFRVLNLQEAANLIIRNATLPDPATAPTTNATTTPPATDAQNVKTNSKTAPTATTAPTNDSSSSNDAITISTEPAPDADLTDNPFPNAILTPTPASTATPATTSTSTSATTSEPDSTPASATTKNLRNHEVARRLKAHRKISTDKTRPATSSADTKKPGTNTLLVSILRELKNLNRHQSFAEFSVFKMFAALVQMIVILFLILAFWFWSSLDPRPDSVHTCLLLAVVFQTLTLTLLMMHKQQ